MQRSIKGFVADQLGDLSPTDIPNFIFALFLCAFLNYLLLILYKRYGGHRDLGPLPNFILLGLGAAVLVTVVGRSLPLSLAAIALFSLLRIRKGRASIHQQVFTLIALVVGVSCGAGYGFVVALAFPIIALSIFLGRDRAK